jgi:putative ABC transport system permease protein
MIPARFTPLPLFYAARNIGRSPLRLGLTAFGGALVVFLVVGAMASVRALDVGVRASGTPGNVMLVGAGSEESVERSEIPASAPGVLAASIEGIRARAGAAYISPELHVPLPLRREGDPAPEGSARSLALVRGVEPAAFLVHPQARLASGRLPDAGADEVAVGRSLAETLRLTDADMAGSAARVRVLIDEHPHTVTGIIDAPGVAIDGEAWMPITDLLVLTKRQTISAAIVSLDGADIGDLEAFAARRSDLEIAAIDEPAYYAQLAQFFKPVQILIGMSALVVAIGAMLGGLNALDASFASRSREIAMLQVLGYSRTAVIASLMQESVLAVATGALPAVLIARLALDGAGVRFSMGVFALSIDATCVASGLAAGLLLGLVGSLPPAIRCLRSSLPIALKADLA